LTYHMVERYDDDEEENDTDNGDDDERVSLYYHTLCEGLW